MSELQLVPPPVALPDVRWSPQQEEALRAAERWLKESDEQVFKLFGFAGTGKTTLARYLAALVEGGNGLVLYAAFTGKAASVLRSKGANGAQTLHSLLYKANDTDKSHLEELHRELKRIRGEIDELLKGQPEAENPRIIARQIESMEREYRQVFRAFKKERARTNTPFFGINPESALRDASLLILDEVSMVNEQLAQDVLSFGKKVLVLGDPAQLPPVKGTGYFIDRGRPNILLTEIHRQARDNPILRFATMARERRTIPFCDEGAARKIRKNQITMTELAHEGGQLLIGKNDTRRKINRGVRKVLGFFSTYPAVGEKLVVLRNDKELNVMNGVVCEAASDARFDDEEGELLLDLNYEGNLVPMVPLDPAEFDIYDNPEAADEIAARSGWDRRRLLQMDFGYGLTVHKAQGSEWPVVTLCDDGFGNVGRDRLRERWLYTAITRAQSRLTIVA